MARAKRKRHKRGKQPRNRYGQFKRTRARSFRRSTASKIRKRFGTPAQWLKKHPPGSVRVVRVRDL